MRAPLSKEAHGGPEVDLTAGEALDVVMFSLGRSDFVVARDQVRAIRASPRLESPRDGAAASLPLVSLSAVLALDRDASTDRRVLEVVHWGQALGVEVTAIAGIRTLRVDSLRSLPPMATRTCTSDCILGLTWDGAKWVVALDLTGLLVERGVEVPDSDNSPAS